MSYDLNACHEVANEYFHRANMENRSFTHNVIEDKTYKIKQLYLTMQKKKIQRRSTQK